MLGVKLELSINGVTEELAEWGNVDTAALQETRSAARGTC